MFDSRLFERALIEPAKKGADSLRIVSGYATASMAKQHLKQLKALQLSPNIELTVGMAAQGLSAVQHKGFQSMHEPPSFSCKYIGHPPPVHAKVYSWLKDGKPFAAFAGSANYTQKGFGDDQAEILAAVEAKTAADWAEKVYNSAYFCNDSKINRLIPLKTEEHKNIHANLEKHLLPLHLKGKKEVHNRSGLNWGKREGREANQAYIPIPSKLYTNRKNFFPAIAKPFTVLTDDQQSMILAAAQQRGKALHSIKNNSELGLYFRRRLNLQPGEYVRYEHLEKYGRFDVEFTKIDSETFYMDFSSKKP